MPNFGGGGGGATAQQVWEYATRALTDILGSDYTPARAALLSQITAVRLAELDAANLPADIDTLVTRLTAARAALLDEITAVRLAELNAANLPADIDTLVTRLTAARAGYLDNLNQAGLLDLTAARAALLDNLDAAVSSVGGGSQLPEILSSFGLYSLGPDLAAQAVAAPASVAWPSADLAIYIPFSLPQAITVVSLWVLNGSPVSGNLDMGIYQPNGTKVVSMGSTAQSGTNALQTLNIADTVLAAGRYYLGLVLDNTTGTVFMATAGTVVPRAKTLGLYQQASAFALPSPATYATYATPGAVYVPLCGMSLRTTI